jgi:predicted RNA-binding Zn ribbon-like protein
VALNDLEFRFRGGRLCLDFVATYGGRHREGVERLGVPADLDHWFRTALGSDGDMLATVDDLVSARELREAIYRLVDPATRDEMRATDVDLVNSWAAQPDFAPELTRSARSSILRSRHAAEAGLSTIARDAIDLLSGPLLERVRECAFPGCCLLFLDASRTQQRQWCEMKSCGNRYKVRQYRKAHAR